MSQAVLRFNAKAIFFYFDIKVDEKRFSSYCVYLKIIELLKNL